MGRELWEWGCVWEGSFGAEEDCRGEGDGRGGGGGGGGAWEEVREEAGIGDFEG